MTRLERLKMLHEAGTAAPWGNFTWSGRCHKDHRHEGPPGCVYDWEKSEPDRNIYVSTESGTELIGYGEDGPVLSVEDARLVVAARNALPDFIALLGAISTSGEGWIAAAQEIAARYSAQ